jgi:hypothetical protein
MRTIFFYSFLLLWTFSSITADAATTRHKYNMGTVSYFGNNQVVIESGTYTMMPKVKVIRIVKESSGAYYERKGSLSDVGVGKRVNLKAIGKRVSEIVVER